MPFTQDNDLDLLFPEELVPQHVKDELPSELHVRRRVHRPIFSFPNFSICLKLKTLVSPEPEPEPASR